MVKGMAEYIDRDYVLKLLGVFNDRVHGDYHFMNGIETAKEIVEDAPATDVLPIPDGGIGEVSDGYHTFNGLYYQRMILFAALVKQNKDKAWKSLRHEDGELCFGGGWFIVGIDTPSGSYTYHYEDNFWSMFDCQELPVAKHWDGHTEKDVTRLLSLPEDVAPVVHGKWEEVQEWMGDVEYSCSVCGCYAPWKELTTDQVCTEYCPHCGSKMDGEA
jgi:hypothetical protein